MAMGLFSCVDLHFSINEDSIEFEEEDEEPEMWYITSNLPVLYEKLPMQFLQIIDSAFALSMAY